MACTLQFARDSSSLFKDVQCQTYQKFKDKIERYRYLRPELTVHQIGAIIVQQLIINKIKKIKNILPNSPAARAAASVRADDNEVTIEKLNKRLQYFKDETFIKNFCKNLPINTEYGSRTSEASYTVWINTLFNAESKDIRSDLESRSPVQQCLAAMPEFKNAQIVKQSRSPCYICGFPMTPNNSTPECEHLLPVLTALSLWWLIKKPAVAYSPEQLNFLRKIYRWSHSCCNQEKSNFDLVFLTTRGAFLNTLSVRQLLLKIIYSGRDDCNIIREANNIFPRTTGEDIIAQYIQERIQVLKETFGEIITNINGEFQVFNNDYELYMLYAKFKVLAALSDASFTEMLTSISGEFDPNERKRKAAAAKAAITRRLNIQRQEQERLYQQQENERRRQLQQRARERRSLGRRSLSVKPKDFSKNKQSQTIPVKQKDTKGILNLSGRDLFNQFFGQKGGEDEGMYFSQESVNEVFQLIHETDVYDPTDAEIEQAIQELMYNETLIQQDVEQDRVAGRVEPVIQYQPEPIESSMIPSLRQGILATGGQKRRHKATRKKQQRKNKPKTGKKQTKKYNKQANKQINKRANKRINKRANKQSKTRTRKNKNSK